MNNYGQPQHQQYAAYPTPQQPQQMWQQPDLQQQQYQMTPQQQQMMHQHMMYAQQQQQQQGQQGASHYPRPTPLPPPSPIGRGGMMPGYPPSLAGLPPGAMMPGMMMHGMPPGMSPGMQVRPGFPGMPMPNFNPPSPLPMPEEEERDPRLDDPWLIDFMKRNEKPPHDESDWSAHKIKARLREAAKAIQQLKALQTQINETKPNSTQFTTIAEEAKSSMTRVDKLFNILDPSDPAFERFKRRIKKNKKHQTWLRKARARVKVDKTNKAQKTANMHRLIDEWQSKLIGKDVARRKTDEDRKQRKLQEKLKQHEKREATHLYDVLLKLEELRALRAQTLELEDQQVSSTPLDQVLEQFIKENPMKEEEKKNGTAGEGEKMEDEDGVVISKAVDEEKKDNKEVAEEAEKEKEKEGEAEAVPEVKSITEEDVRKYYEQAYESIDRLIAVRRVWDQFVVPAGFGTRIPPSFITPPPPSRGWRKYIRKKKKKQNTSPTPTSSDPSLPLSVSASPDAPDTDMPASS